MPGVTIQAAAVPEKPLVTARKQETSASLYHLVPLWLHALLHGGMLSAAYIPCLMLLR